MKRVVISGFVFCFLFFLLISLAMAEDYVSKAFPSIGIIAKAVNTGNNNFVKLVGKFQDKDGGYHVFYNNSNDYIDSIDLTKLDTDVWIYRDGGRTKILQK